MAGVFILAILTVATELLTKRPATQVSQVHSQRLSGADLDRRNAEVISAMGLKQHLKAKWLAASRAHLDATLAMSDLRTIGTVSKVFRMVLQSTVLAVGASW